ncbi:MAG TPA: chemotaxis protein CheB [Pyrinomonadaceae bacterium]|jgi:two-component system CheB/CheR fusion protein
MSSIDGGGGDDAAGIPLSFGDGFMVVGLGASAGGVRAFKEFFANVPERSGMAYVVILHLSPEHESRLAEVLQADTLMPVTQVREDVRVEPDRVYVIPPNKSLRMSDGLLTLSDVTSEEERRAPVDIFFRTLADAHGPRAACVVLSGTGADGSMGLKRVKEHGGAAVAQEPAEADYSDMPRNAIATGLVDYVLPAAEMPARLMAYRDTLKLVEARAPDAEEPAAGRDRGEAPALSAILGHLRLRTGHDFTNYKRPTVRRRIDRRISVTQATDITEYARLMRERPSEAHALLKDLLISVTNFFRDRAAFEALERDVIPRLFEEKGAGDHVRVWVAGCATGEEAYSVAMLLTEHAETLASPPAIQVFASDLDERAIGVARAGFYTLNDAADVSPERLRRFFARTGDGYSVRRELRELVLFASHNLLKDPPFSHLDLVTCRNLLIYLNRAGQDKAMGVFHFALNPGGYLFLGGSETAADHAGLFVTVNKEAHIFRSRAAVSRVAPQLFADAAPRRAALPPEAPEAARGERRAHGRVSYLDLHQWLLEAYAPPSALVNADYEIVHLSDSAGRFLVLPGGEPSHNLLTVVRPELRLELRSALFHAAQRGTAAKAPPVAVRVGDRFETVRPVVRPVTGVDDTANGFFLVLFETPAGAPAPAAGVEVVTAVEPAARQLEEELLRLKSQLRSTVEQYEVQHEELRASNEELQAMNEELRSTAEELETSKEEFQSLNEELTTVNQELKNKIEEMGQLNNDLQNLIGSTDFATVFLDRSMRVKLFTPRARELFNFIPSDVGRPISDITGQVAYSDLADDVERVYEDLTTVERELRTAAGRYYVARVAPYRTAEDVINGVVLTFTDVTERKEAREQALRSESRLRRILDSAEDYAIFSQDAAGRINGWFAGAERTFGFTAEEALGSHAAIIFTPEDRARGVPGEEMRVAREQGRAADERWHVRKDGSRFYASGVLAPLGDAPDSGFVKIARDLTEQQRAGEELRAARDELERRVVSRTEELSGTVEAMLAEVKERRAAEEQARTLVGQLVTAQEDERRRISRDLHDQLGQQLTALRLGLDALKERCGQDAGLCGVIEELQERAARLDEEVDFLAWEMRPTALDDLGLEAALANYVEEWSRHCHIPAEFQSAAGADGRLTPEVETCLYRIAQEALNNVYKHAQAARVSVILERRGPDVLLVVEDDGVGFVEADAGRWEGGRGLGLVGMRERAALLGGSVEFESEPGRGTAIFARVPARGARPDGGR